MDRLCAVEQGIRFLSTPSARRATGDPRNGNRPEKHFYPRPPRGGRPLVAQRIGRTSSNFYPRPPRGGRLVDRLCAVEQGIRFLSTPSARRATGDPRNGNRPEKHFYPRPPRGGRPLVAQRIGRTSSNFYPRPPRGGRQTRRAVISEASTFLSTPSARRATDVQNCY